MYSIILLQEIVQFTNHYCTRRDVGVKSSVWWCLGTEEALDDGQNKIKQSTFCSLYVVQSKPQYMLWCLPTSWDSNQKPNYVYLLAWSCVGWSCMNFQRLNLIQFTFEERSSKTFLITIPLDCHSQKLFSVYVYRNINKNEISTFISVLLYNVFRERADFFVWKNGKIFFRQTRQQNKIHTWHSKIIKEKLKKMCR
jgi:hypothetical protein